MLISFNFITSPGLQMRKKLISHVQPAGDRFLLIGDTLQVIGVRSHGKFGIRFQDLIR